MHSFKKTTRHVCIFYFSSIKYQFSSISKISISFGVRPLDPLLGLRPRTPLGDFCPPGYFPLCVNPSPQSCRAVYATVYSHSLNTKYRELCSNRHLTRVARTLAQRWTRCKVALCRFHIRWSLPNSIRPQSLDGVSKLSAVCQSN